MGDRRGNERASLGRRETDSKTPISVNSWVSTSINAHLLGQWMAPGSTTTAKAVTSYERAGIADVKKGTLA